MKMYKVIETPTLLYGSETWVPSQKFINKMPSVEIKFLKGVKDC